jgi:hypothetical protein
MVKADRASTEQCGLSGWLKPHFAFAAAELARAPSVVAFWFGNLPTTRLWRTQRILRDFAAKFFLLPRPVLQDFT